MGRKSILGIITIRRDSSHVKFLKAWRKSKTSSVADSLCLRVYNPQSFCKKGSRGVWVAEEGVFN